MNETHHITVDVKCGTTIQKQRNQYIKSITQAMNSLLPGKG